MTAFSPAQVLELQRERDRYEAALTDALARLEGATGRGGTMSEATRMGLGRLDWLDEATARRLQDAQAVLGDVQRWHAEQIAALQPLVNAVGRWIYWGNVKTLHVATCTVCEERERVDGVWCDEAQQIGRRQLNAAQVMRDAYAEMTR